MEPLTEQVTFRVTKTTLAQVQQLAEKEERKIADVLRRLLVKSLKMRKG